MAEGSATFLVVGGGIAAVSCVEQLAEMCPDESIVVLAASQLVKTVSNWEKMGYAMESFDVQETSAESVFKEFKNVKVVHCYCTGINAEKQEAYASNGQQFRYQKLCLAAGGRPKLLSDNPFVIGIRDTESVRDFQTRLKNCRRIMVVGNGGIATELVYELKKVHVVWVVKHRNVSATFVDAGAAEFFMDSINKKDSKEESERISTGPKKRLKYTHAGKVDIGTVSSQAAPGSALGPDWVEDLTIMGAAEDRLVSIEYESEVDRILTPSELKNTHSTMGTTDEDGSWPVYVVLSSGKLYGCDLIISATGVIPNSQLFVSNQCSLQLGSDGGIRVDNEFKTSIPNIYAAGDICTMDWALAQHWFQMRLWTQARQMGAFVGRCMASHFIDPNSRVELDICFEIFTHVTKFFGYKIVLLGLFNGQKLGLDYEVLLRVKKGDEYVKVVVAANRIHGAILIGETDLEETMENLILNQTDISQIKDDLLNPTIDIEDYFD